MKQKKTTDTIPHVEAYATAVPFDRTKMLQQFKEVGSSSSREFVRQDEMKENIKREIRSNHKLKTIIEERGEDIEDYVPDLDDMTTLDDQRIADYEDAVICCGYEDDDDYLTTEEAITCVERLFERIGAYVMAIFPFLKRKVRQCNEVCMEYR